MAQAVLSEYEEMIKLLLDFTTTPGTLGVLAAHEGDNYYQFNRHGIAMGILPNKTFSGTAITSLRNDPCISGCKCCRTCTLL